MMAAHETFARHRPAMAEFAKDRHKRAAKALGYALTLDSESGWHALSMILTARLSREERAALAFAALCSLDDDAGRITADFAIAEDAGPPLGGLADVVQDAQLWASVSSPRELDAYAVACVRAMRPDRRRAFSRFVAQTYDRPAGEGGTT